MIFKIKPFSRKNYGFAPELYVDSQDKSGRDVPKIARAMSGLGRFESWDFSTHVTRLKTN